jgi:hypothetical protein
LKHEARAQFRPKIVRLREHFEQFNVDTSELCQWLMGLRKRYVESCKARGEPADPADPAGFGALGAFLLEPSFGDVDADEAERDRWRLHVFDDVAGFRACRSVANQPLPQWLRDAVDAEAATRPSRDSKNSNCYKLFERLRTLEPQHRLVLLKAAAEWVVARYRRGVENWVRGREEWQKEKMQWEQQNPELTEEARNRFTDIFRNLRPLADGPAASTGADDTNGRTGIRKKRPRICPYERIAKNIDNCVYAGEKGHGPLCWKFEEFVKKQNNGTSRKFNHKYFAKNAEIYLTFRAKGQDPNQAKNSLYQQERKCKPWFASAWMAYLNHLNLTEQTVVDHRELPHCLRIAGKTYEKSECRWNPHTELCKQYKRAVDSLDEQTRKLESLYRDWRRDFLAGPAKPAFKYPSSRDLPMPKIFGADFYGVDFERSVLRLRLDDMPAGEWIEFGFIPWPRGYNPSRAEIKDRVTSVHVNFLGTRARVGFRFDASHKVSRFGCTQDDLDELRSRRFPRPAQDQEFLNAARKRLLETFSGAPESDLQLLAVDLGETGACAALYHGRQHKQDLPLSIVKINRLYETSPKQLKPDKKGRPADTTFDKEDPRGLRKQHVGRHLERLAAGMEKLTARRQPAVPTTVTARTDDYRGLKRHIAWMIRDWVRHNAAQVVAAAEQHHCDLIVFESFRGFTPPGYDKLDTGSERKKRWLAMFAYGRIRRKVVEKAVERGMRVVTVPYFKSSQVCSACGRAQENVGLLRKNKNQRKFICEHKGCSEELNSDANAARVLARVFWGEITLPSPEKKSSHKG